MKLTVLYFARLREALACDAETLVLPDGVGDIAGLRAHLVARGGAWQALAASTVRAALNQDMATPDAVLRDGDEVAFFPPVTGG
ncbi:molybdopterin converting factor subunit 1 [Uliginosibacterium sp. H1]|uniref:molybdopterin converting factor subunit 1 n=1 Tax=Uliginosibacterium sp. H1 TaxID=3114757 RepID=UPI002E19BCBB|nr:molybdopterin converting factor subunit 1 [Uliginosibacterium sp. H1]